MLTQNQIEDIVELLYTLDNTTKIYFGCDSKRFKRDGKWHAKYATVVVIHVNGKNGCKMFVTRSEEPDYDLKKNRPSMRMMNETMKVCEVYNQLAPFIDEFDSEIHLDINTDVKHGSNCAATAAAGYVLGVTGVEPKLKPESFAASFSADWYANGRDTTKSEHV